MDCARVSVRFDAHVSLRRWRDVEVQNMIGRISESVRLVKNVVIAQQPLRYDCI